ncbi:MAG: YqhA family protein [Desulfobacterales bacterium]|nr:YqhA family protein [Deltaproteobacteria bacterium]NNL76921.1 YqhA family protein [Desulfobacterales bacterium]
MTKIIAFCRYLLMVPVVGCIILTAGVVFMGIVRIYTGAAKLVGAGDYSAKGSKIMALNVIEIIDLFLVGTVSYITAAGLYRLFISDRRIALPIRLNINSLKDLEDKIIGVVVAALAVAFLGQAAGTDEPAQLLNYGGGIALVIAALAFFINYGGKEKGKDDAK